MQNVSSVLLERKEEKRLRAWAISERMSAQHSWFLKKWFGLSKGTVVTHFVCTCSLANYRFTNRGQFAEMKTITIKQILHFLFSLFKGMSVQIGSQPNDGCQMLLQNGPMYRGAPEAYFGPAQNFSELQPWDPDHNCNKFTYNSHKPKPTEWRGFLVVRAWI